MEIDLFRLFFGFDNSRPFSRLFSHFLILLYIILFVFILLREYLAYNTISCANWIYLNWVISRTTSRIWIISRGRRIQSLSRIQTHTPILLLWLLLLFWLTNRLADRHFPGYLLHLLIYFSELGFVHIHITSDIYFHLIHLLGNLLNLIFWLFNNCCDSGSNNGTCSRDDFLSYKVRNYEIFYDLFYNETSY